MIGPLGCRSNVLLVVAKLMMRSAVAGNRPNDSLLLREEEGEPTTALLIWDPLLMLTKISRRFPPRAGFSFGLMVILLSLADMPVVLI